jgi:hypothetical protein
LKSGEFWSHVFPKKSIVDVAGPFFFSQKWQKFATIKKYWYKFPGLSHDA